MPWMKRLRRGDYVDQHANDMEESWGYVRLRSSAEAGHLVAHGTALVAIRAVVVARQHVRVHVAQTDPVVSVLVAGVDARLVPADAGIDNVLGSALVRERGAGEACSGGDDEERGTHLGCIIKKK